MKILIADRDWIVRDSLARLVVEILPAAQIVTAGDRPSVENALGAHADLDIVVLDDAIVGNDEESVFARVRKQAPKAAIGVLTVETDRERVLKAIYFGAVAIILKHEEREHVAQSLALLLSGQVAFPRHILARGPTPKPAPAPRDFDKRDADDSLTPREREVIGLIGRGQSVAKIATALGLSPHTVRVHVTRIMKKLDLRDRPALMHYAVMRSQATMAASETAH